MILKQNIALNCCGWSKNKPCHLIWSPKTKPKELKPRIMACHSTGRRCHQLKFRILMPNLPQDKEATPVTGCAFSSNQSSKQSSYCCLENKIPFCSQSGSSEHTHHLMARWNSLSSTSWAKTSKVGTSSQCLPPAWGLIVGGVFEQEGARSDECIINTTTRGWWKRRAFRNKQVCGDFSHTAVALYLVRHLAPVRSTAALRIIWYVPVHTYFVRTKVPYHITWCVRVLRYNT